MLMHRKTYNYSHARSYFEKKLFINIREKKKKKITTYA